MPPPTTLLGIAGAALGLSDSELWAPNSPLRGLKVSVWMDEQPGRARDMWTVLKIKGGKIAERSPYFRELLFFTCYTLFYGGEEVLLRQLAEAFRDPAYPLSLGREDELLLVEEVKVAEAQQGEPLFRGTVVPGDIRHMSGVRPLLREGAVFEPPVVEKLPLAFTVDDRGVRSPDAPALLSFLPLGVELEVPGAQAWWWEKRAFTWTGKGQQS